MNRRLKELLAAAGSTRPGANGLMLIAGSLLASGITQEILGVPGLSLAILAGCLAVEYEIISLRSKIRQHRIDASWPIVLESLESAAVAGMSLLESLRDLSESEQL